MSEFDARAHEWDNNPVHWERSEAIAKNLLEMIPVGSNMKAMEYGAGTGILSFILSQNFSEITLMDNSSTMVNVMHEKVKKSQLNNMKPLFFDLEHSNYNNGKFDCIFSQMLLHHVTDPVLVLDKFYHILNPGGYLAVSDLYPEDGSFHNPDAKVHYGFDPNKLTEILKNNGFSNIEYKTCYNIKRDSGKEYPIFLLVAKKVFFKSGDTIGKDDLLIEIENI